MNCATHSTSQAVAFCRTCGKPLCAVCARDVRGTIFCESCLADRLAGMVPPAPAATPGAAPGVMPGSPPPPMPGVMPVSAAPMITPASGPNPALAGILAGFLPFGVGAVYNGQYAKGLAHLLIFVGTIVALSSDLPWYIDTILGIGLGFFYFYQIIDAVRSAHAIQAGQPAPDPFGLAQTFATGDAIDTSKIPTGAVVLIGLGVIFLLHTIGVFQFAIGQLWPLFFMFLGGWLFAKRWGLVGTLPPGCHCERCRARHVMGPAILFTIGLVAQLAALHIVSFSKTWPVLFLVIGGVKLFEGNASTAGHMESVIPAFPVTPQVPAIPPVQQGPTIPGTHAVTSVVPDIPSSDPTEVNRG
jgi:hypothetical protein